MFRHLYHWHTCEHSGSWAASCFFSYPSIDFTTARILSAPVPGTRSCWVASSGYCWHRTPQREPLSRTSPGRFLRSRQSSWRLNLLIHNIGIGNHTTHPKYRWFLVFLVWESIETRLPRGKMWCSRRMTTKRVPWHGSHGVFFGKWISTSHWLGRLVAVPQRTTTRREIWEHGCVTSRTSWLNHALFHLFVLLYAFVCISHLPGKKLLCWYRGHLKYIAYSL